MINKILVDGISSIWIDLKWHLVRQHDSISAGHIATIHHSDLIKIILLCHLLMNFAVYLDYEFAQLLY